MLSSLALTLTLAAAPGDADDKLKQLAQLVALPPEEQGDRSQAREGGPLEHVAPASALPAAPLGRADAPSFGGLGWGLVLGLAAAAAALLASRRGRGGSLRALRVVEHAAIGKGRSLLLVEAGGESFLLASSEAGVQVIGQPRAAQAAPSPAPEQTAGLWRPSAPRALEGQAAGGVLASLGRLAAQRGRARERAEPAFADELQSCLEDVQLRQKLAAAGRRSDDGLA